MDTTQTISYRGYSYHYRLELSGEESGSRPPVIFLSGAFQTMASWRRFVEAFLPSTDVLLLDLPGSGSADPLPPKFGLDYLAEALHRVLQRLDLPPAYLVCASYGSPIGYRYAQRFPGRISHLVLAGVMASIPVHVREPMERAVSLASSGHMKEFAELTLQYLLCRDPDRVVLRRDSVRRALFRSLVRMSDADLLRFVWNTQRLLRHPALELDEPPEVPTLVFTGEHDTFTEPERCRWVADHIPGARFTTIPAADHVFHLQRFDATVDLLHRFAYDQLGPPTNRVPALTA